MTVSECVTVLRLWLLALAAKDCGVVVSIQPQPQSLPQHSQPLQPSQERQEREEDKERLSGEGSYTTGCWNESSSIDIGCRWEVVRLQTDQEAGLLRLIRHTLQNAHVQSQAFSQDQVHAYVNSLETAKEDDCRAKENSIATTIATDAITATSTTSTASASATITTVYMFSYSVGLVDLGPKPLDKAAKKDANEDEFCAVAGHCIDSKG